MAGNWNNFSKSDVCPICGHDDWCGWQPGTKGRLILCQRDTDKRSFTRGAYQYEYKRDSATSSASLYVEMPIGANAASGEIPKRYVGVSELKPVDIVEPAPPTVLDKLYRKLQEILVLEKHHREYLHKQGWSDEMIEYYHIVSMPEKDEYRKKYKNRNYCKNKYRAQVCKELISAMEPLLGKNCLKGMPGAFMVKDGNWTLYGPSGILFPIFDTEGRVIRMRLRKDFEDVDAKIYGTGDNKYFFNAQSEKIYVSMKGHCKKLEDGTKEWLSTGGKYRYLHSFIQDRNARKDGLLKNLLTNGVQVPNMPSIYTRPTDDKSLWFICEGEPKSMLSNWILERPFIDIPGVSSWSLAVTDEMIAFMKSQGMKGVCIAFDADQFDMIKHRDVRTYAINLMLRLMDAGVTVVEAVWDEDIAKGLDDLLAADGFPEFRYPKREDLVAEKEEIQNKGRLLSGDIFDE